MAYKAEEIVIGYNVDDIQLVRRLTETLRDSDFSVWYATGEEKGDGTSTAVITQAILSCKVFVIVLSEQSANDKPLQDQMSLAYISNSCIFPIGTARHRFLNPVLGSGAKLILAKINWCFVLRPEDYTKNIANLIQCIRLDLKDLQDNPPDDNTDLILTHGMAIDLKRSIDLGGTDGYEGYEPIIELDCPLEHYTSFWDRHFEGCSSVMWTRLRDEFFNDYGKVIEKGAAGDAEERKKLVASLIHKDVFRMSAVVERSAYEAFCQLRNGTSHRFYHCTMDYIAVYLSLRDVISVDSSLRMSTVQSLGKFKFFAIINGLAELLKDDDANIRAIAAIALAKAGRNDQNTVPRLLGILNDEDRLVRESACLSLGYLQASNAVGHIVDRWRNDPISSVRQAAEIALGKMKNVEEARQCIKVTQILSDEMSLLKPKQ